MASATARKSSPSWLPPVPSPLLSPARDKSLHSVKKKKPHLPPSSRLRSSSIFSSHPTGKSPIDSEEPTSPTVSCIGQVKSCRKTKGDASVASASSGSSSSTDISLATLHSRSGSGSPARFFSSPARHSKWASLFGSRKGSIGSGQDMEENQKPPRIWPSVLRTDSCSESNSNNNKTLLADHIHGRSTYDQLPPLQSFSCKTQNLKISLEVVPETWLWRHNERLADSSGSMPDKLESVRRADPAASSHHAGFPTLDASSHDPSSYPPGHCSNLCLPVACSDSTAAAKPSTVVPVGINSCKQLRDLFNDVDKEQGIVDANNPERAGSCFHDKRTDTHAESKGFSQTFSAMERNQKDSMTDVLEKKLDENFGKRNLKLTDFCKGHKPGSKSKNNRREPGKSFGTVILVGYNLNENAESKIANCKRLLKGTLEVGRLSFHGTGNYLQFLNSEAEFIRSRSATSHRTVIRLQRCNSEPSKPSQL